MQEYGLCWRRSQVTVAKGKIEAGVSRVRPVVLAAIQHHLGIDGQIARRREESRMSGDAADGAADAGEAAR